MDGRAEQYKESEYLMIMVPNIQLWTAYLWIPFIWKNINPYIFIIIILSFLNPKLYCAHWAKFWRSSRSQQGG